MGAEPAGLNVTLRDKETGEMLYESKGDTYGIKENTALYSFLKQPVSVESGKTYELEISSDAATGSGIGLYCVTDKKGQELLTVAPAREEGQDPAEEKRCLQMCVSGIQ